MRAQPGRGGHPAPSGHRSPVRLRLWLLLVPALLTAACGVGDGNSTRQPTPTPPAVGWSGEVDDAPYVAYERVTYERLPRGRLEPAGEVRLPEQVRRVAAFKLRDSESNAIRFTDDAGRGWLAWQPTIVLRARRDFAQQQGGQPSQVTTLGVARVEWPDSCLGVDRAGRSCAQVVTPGFRITLRLGAATAIFHTDLRERVVLASG